MRRASVLLSVAILAAGGTVSAPTDCENNSQLGKAYKKTCVTYKTQPGDNPYTLAKQFYGKGYMEYKIRAANKDLLTAAGFFPPGTRILVPPDDRGRPVDVTRPDKVDY
ncbi:MAG TPA: hypothetical protein VM238_15590 [Phycisphaerae bacterium]|nr:hypothetical protein [Phycisphaerae bacterium]